MRKFQIWWDDLTPSAKKRLRPLYDPELEVTPITTVEYDDGEDDDMFGIDEDFID